MNEESLPRLFTALMLFNNLRFPLMMFPWILTMFGDAQVSMGRLQEFLMRDEVPDEMRSYTSERGLALKIDDGRFEVRFYTNSGGFFVSYNGLSDGCYTKNDGF